MERTDWEQLPDQVRAEVTRHTGPVHSARTAATGRNLALAAVLDTPSGTVFVKGLRSTYPAQLREAVINPYVSQVSPKLLWHTVVDDWRLLGFAHAAGRRYDSRYAT